MQGLKEPEQGVIPFYRISSRKVIPDTDTVQLAIFWKIDSGDIAKCG